MKPQYPNFNLAVEFTEHPEAPKKANRYPIDYNSGEFLDWEYTFSQQETPYPEHEAALRILTIQGQKLQYLKQEIIASKSEHKYYSHRLKNICFWSFVSDNHLANAISDLRAVLYELSKEIDWIQAKIDELNGN